MMTQIRNRRRSSRRKQAQFAFVITVVFLVCLGAIIWIFNIENVVKGPWASIMSVIFAALGAVTALLQWHSQSAGEERLVTFTPPVQKFGFQNHSQVETTSPVASEQKGALLVHARRSLHGMTINLKHGFNAADREAHFAANVVESEEYGHTTFTSVFPLLEPGNYLAYVNSEQLEAKVTVLPGQIAEIDWR